MTTLLTSSAHSHDSALYDFEGEKWWFPVYDEKLRLVYHTWRDILPAVDLVRTSRRFEHISTERRICVQAGGACGVFPIKLYETGAFERVISVEPNRLNYEVMRTNLAWRQLAEYHVEPVHAALLDNSNVASPVSLWRLPHETNNAGAIHVRSDNMVMGTGTVEIDERADATTVDDLCADYLSDDERVVLLYLDIEGTELFALRGAERILREHKPIVVVEQKGLESYYGIARDALWKFMAERGYTLVAKFNNDFFYDLA